MKKIILLFLLFFSLTIQVKADSINKITMDIYLDSYGTAHITEKWDVNINNGTEGYKPYYNIGNAEITNFTVSANDKLFTYQSNWDVNGTLQDKAYKNGINYLYDGLELCWGISNYGKNIYTLKYNIEGFVSETADKQMIFWTLIPHELSLKPKEVNIVIWADDRFEDTVPVWGYGNYGGTAYVYDGKIEMNSDGKLDSDEYMTILVEFPAGKFQTNNILDKTFDDYYNMAEEGSRHYKNVLGIFKIITFVVSLLSIIPTFIPVVIFALIIKSFTNKYFVKNISKGKFSKNLNYFRDIPCNKDIFYAYFLASNYKLMKNNNDFLGTLILSWIKDGYVKVEKIEKKGLFKKGEESSLVMNLDKFTNSLTEKNLLEAQMFDYMYEASQDGILESKEFSIYCQQNYSKVLKWFDKVLEEEKTNAINFGLLEKVKKLTTKYYETNAIYEEAKKLAGLKKFLKDFSSIDDKSSIEVNLWEYYLMYAQIFGIADKVSAEFKKLYPDVINDMAYDNVIFIYTMSSNSMRSAVSAKSKAESYSSGGGGFSSGGGGGGSSGGGRGGGGFR